MPELPDVELYLHAIGERTIGHRLRGVRVASPFFVRSVDPPMTEVYDKEVRELRRVGKRIVLCFEGDLFAVIHLMIAGRFRWLDPGAAVPKKIGLAAFDFDHGALIVTEVSKKKRASLHFARGKDALTDFDPGGIEPLGLSLEDFSEAILRTNHTLKRALTDPRILSGIGNAYSDEILHHARLSPVTWTSRLTAEQVARLNESTQTVLTQWRDKLIEECGDGFPEKVTAFRPDMAAHGKYAEPCPRCSDPIQRIKYASRETNYCATCQTGGKLLADRGLSRLLKGDWPRTLEELEARKRPV